MRKKFIEKWIVEKAPAKINLFLDVLSRRTDGYHNIRSVMQSISLCDKIKVKNDEDEGYTLSCRSTIPGDANLLCKALQKFYEHVRPIPTYEVELEKSIPICAGLGGGSSDAAAAIRALNKLYGKPLKDDYISNLLSELGSDVSFCMTGGTAICEGRGEIITPINSPQLYYLLLNGGSISKSKYAYKELDIKYLDFIPARNDNADFYYKELLSYLFGYTSKFPTLFNIFEDVVLKGEETPSLAHRILLEYSASGVLMTGSGPYVFGAYESKELRDKAYDELYYQRVDVEKADSLLIPVKDNSKSIMEAL